jgi:ssDNA-binding Zn-finger/Zn-ribbon topoisomerase 1
MKELEEIGECPNCGCTLIMYKTSNHKRFVKCEGCGISYPVPKWGKIHSSALLCPMRSYPILIVKKSNSKAYFWTDRPCFDCMHSDKCEEVQSLIQEFTELEVYGY